MHGKVHSIWVVLSKSWPISCYGGGGGSGSLGSRGCSKAREQLLQWTMNGTKILPHLSTSLLIHSWLTALSQLKRYIQQVLKKKQRKCWEKNPLINHIDGRVNIGIIAGWAFYTCQEIFFLLFLTFSACRLCAQHCTECPPPGHSLSCDSHLCAGTTFECPSEQKPPNPSDITVQTGSASAAVFLARHSPPCEILIQRKQSNSCERF